MKITNYTYMILFKYSKNKKETGEALSAYAYSIKEPISYELTIANLFN